jgi:multicomponent K+:H+ antiporter subunit D
VSLTLPHLVVVPVVLPLLAAALMLVLGDRRRRLTSIINIGATGAGLLAALAILGRVDADGVPGAIGVYLTANWEAPFGIVLVADRLSALMLVLTGVVALATAVYARAAWSRAGVYFHPLFQIQLMGLNGAFLTGDLFNLFVFFEVVLAASYGLLLHGSGWARVHSGLHYIAVNLLASSLFLVGLAMFYGIMGTLSMADIAAKLPHVAAADRGLLHAGAAILAVAFLTKAAIWPLSSWLVPAYLAASAPVAALFALMTKVGIYALLRLSTLFFSADAGPSAHFGASVFLYGGLATGAFGVLGLMASLRLGRIAGFSIIVSSGTLLAAIGIGVASVTSTALFYLLSSTLAASLLFLLVELVERQRIDRGRAPLPDVDVEPGEDTNLDDEEEALVGRVIPVPLALLGLAFIACAVLVAGLPPLSGFVAKVTLMAALSRSADFGISTAPTGAIWSLFALLVLSGLVATVSMTRTGIRYFWSPADRTAPRLNVAEGVPVLALLLACAWLTVRAEPVLRYTSAAAEALHAPAAYIDAVLSTKPVPGPTQQLADAETGR